MSSPKSPVMASDGPIGETGQATGPERVQVDPRSAQSADPIGVQRRVHRIALALGTFSNTAATFIDEVPRAARDGDAIALQAALIPFDAASAELADAVTDLRELVDVLAAAARALLNEQQEMTH